MIFILLVLSAYPSSAIISGDFNCTMYNGTAFIYAENAVACSNVLSDKYCEVAYPAVNTFDGYPRAGGNADRPLLCYSLAAASPAAIFVDAKTASIANCAKTCGFCCQTTAFSCQNARFPRMNCNSVTKAQCLSVAWRQILAEDCPAVCGFCDLNGCIDLVVGCDSDATICNAVGMQEFVNLNCRRTCGRCNVTPSPCSG